MWNYWLRNSLVTNINRLVLHCNLRTPNKTLRPVSAPRFCVHPYQGPPKDGVPAITWRDEQCSEKRLQLDFYNLRGERTVCCLHFRFEYSASFLVRSAIKRNSPWVNTYLASLAKVCPLQINSPERPFTTPDTVYAWRQKIDDTQYPQPW